MAHMTNKKRRLRDKNAGQRATFGMKLGTKNMGFESNTARKAISHKESWKHLS